MPKFYLVQLSESPTEHDAPYLLKRIESEVENEFEQDLKFSVSKLFIQN
jgi:hypothetical protein